MVFPFYSLAIRKYSMASLAVCKQQFPKMNKKKLPRKKARPARRSDCAVACTLDIVGDRWTLLVVRDLLGGKRHFDDFLRSPERIATNILSARLRALRERGFIQKVPDPSDQRRCEYTFTEEGLHLR